LKVHFQLRLIMSSHGAVQRTQVASKPLQIDRSYKREKILGVVLTSILVCGTAFQANVSTIEFKSQKVAEGTPGCMDARSCNFDAEATVDDLSCGNPADECDDEDPISTAITVTGTAASSLYASKYSASNALANPDTYWISKTPSNQWIEYTFDNAYTITQIGLQGYRHEKGVGGPKNVQVIEIEKSNSAVTTFQTTNQATTFVVYTLDKSVTGKKIRLKFVDRWGTVKPFIIVSRTEFYGVKSEPTSKPTAKPTSEPTSKPTDVTNLLPGVGGCPLGKYPSKRVFANVPSKPAFNTPDSRSYWICDWIPTLPPTEPTNDQTELEI